MHLFKSQWLHEHGRRTQAPAYGRPTFGPRYGRHAMAQQASAIHASPRHDNVVSGGFHTEREILREMARYDHAA
jgi:hypothetical protein